MNHDTEQGGMKSGDDLSHRRFTNPEELAKRFDAPERDEWQKPDQVIKAFQLAADSTVAEIGSGTGYFVVRLAKLLKGGKVIGLDDEAKMVEYLNNRAEKLGMANVEARPISFRGEANLDEKVDLIFSVDTYHHIQERSAYFSHCLQYLKPNGKLVVIDRRVDSPAGPHVRPRIAPDVVKQEMQNAGFSLVNDVDFLPYQYYLVFQAAISGPAPV